MKAGDTIYCHKNYYINDIIRYEVGFYEVIEWGFLFISLRKVDGSGEIIPEFNEEKMSDYFYTLNEYRELKLSLLIDIDYEYD